MTKAAVAAFLFALSGATAAATAEPRPIVVEVYTSQGCTTCLAANVLAGKLAQRPGLLLLSFPVTYWDLLGWKDTLGSEDNTRRQKSYATALRRGGLYTPQMIVDGAKDVPAAREDAVSTALNQAALLRDQGAEVARPGRSSPDAAAHAKQPPVWSVAVSLAKRADALHLAIDRAPDVARRSPIDATVWMFRLHTSASVKIGGGENAGQTVPYRNVVAQITNLGHWHGMPLALDLPKPGPKAPAHDGVAVVVQQSGYGRVVGAAMVSGAPLYGTH